MIRTLYALARLRCPAVTWRRALPCHLRPWHTGSHRHYRADGAVIGWHR